MKCHECNKEAKWIVIDQPPYEELFIPLCEEHFQALREMEGELNIDFELIDNLSLEEVVAKSNEKWKYINKKYSKLLKLYSEMKEEKEAKP